MTHPRKAMGSACWSISSGPEDSKKSDLHYDLWVKNIGPSDKLRQMFHQDPIKNWDAFSTQYAQELAQSPNFADFITCLKSLTPKPTTITLLFAFKNPTKNHAAVLKSALLHQNW